MGIRIAGTSFRESLEMEGKVRRGGGKRREGSERVLAKVRTEFTGGDGIRRKVACFEQIGKVGVADDNSPEQKRSRAYVYAPAVGRSGGCGGARE